MTENEQQVETARAGMESPLVFISYTIQADAFDVFFQNFLQQVINNYDPEGSPYMTEVYTKMKDGLKDALGNTYVPIYREGFGIDCEVRDAIHSFLDIKSSANIKDILLTDNENGFTPIPNARTAVWPYVTHYYLKCETEEPPTELETMFKGRWYFLNADNVCSKVPEACSYSSI